MNFKLISRISFFTLLAGFALPLFGQQVILNIKGAGEGKYYLEEYNGHRIERVDSTMSSREGRLEFDMSEGRQPGIYRIVKNSSEGIDVIFTDQNVEINTEPDFRVDLLDVKEGSQNKIFFDYLKVKTSFESKLSSIDQMLSSYPEDDAFYYKAVDYFNDLENEYNGLIDSLMKLSEEGLVSTIIRWDQLPDLNPATLDPETREFFKEHYFDGIDFSNDMIVRTPVLPVKVIDYLSLFIVPGVTRERQEELFIQGVDSLMVLTEKNAVIRQAMIDYILEGFERYGFEKVITHIGENYVLGKSCVSEQEEEELKLRIEGFTRMAVGQKAPGFSFERADGTVFGPGDVDKPYVMLFFWASWCPHCSAIIPQLKEFYREYADRVEIVSVSVDSDEEEWKRSEREHQVPWPSFAELQGWDGAAVKDYYVYATPALYLIDDQGIIVLKPVSIKELTSFLDK